MKKIILVSFLFSIFLFFGSANNVFGCDTTRCPQGACSLSDPECSGCGASWCNTRPTSGVPEPWEDITGKVYNPVLPLNLSKTPGVTFLQKIIKTGITALLVAGSVLFFFIFASGGLKWLSSSGDKVKLESAQKQITSGLTGLVILLTSFAIIKLVETLFGIDLLNITLPTL